MRRSGILAVAAIVVLASALTALLRRCDRKKLASSAPPAHREKVETPPTIRSSDAPEPGPPLTRDSKPETIPRAERRSLRVRDVFGEPLKGGRITITRSDGRNTPLLVIGEDGSVVLPSDLWEDSMLHCGQIHVPLKEVKRGVAFEIPGKSSRVYGELCVLPLDWDEVRLTPQGEQSWMSAVLTDPTLGHRFPYLLPGTYDIIDRQGKVLGSEIVVAGQRTTHVVTKWCGLKVNVSFAVEPDPLPQSLPVRIKGLSTGSSYPNGFGLFLGIRTGQRSYAQYGLAPGVYHVYVNEQGFHFSDHVDLMPGKVHAMEIRVTGP